MTEPKTSPGTPGETRNRDPEACSASGCKTGRVGVLIRVILSLLVIGLGIYHGNWVGLLGLFTLYTALTGHCATSLRLPGGGRGERGAGRPPRS